MRLETLDCVLRELLDVESFASADKALNGLQVDRDSREVERVAVAVDASMECFRRAAAWRADLLFVHHGLFWGNPVALTGGLYARVRFLVENDLALFGAHLPLDAHPELGNNAALARHIGLERIERFGEYRGLMIGCKGVLPSPLTLADVEQRICPQGEGCIGRLPFGKERIATVGIVSGGDPHGVHEAIEDGLDLYITGDASHEIYHACLESGINVLFGGHYATETWGVREVAKHLADNEGLETAFLDVPTGL